MTISARGFVHMLLCIGVQINKHTLCSAQKGVWGSQSTAAVIWYCSFGMSLLRQGFQDIMDHSKLSNKNVLIGAHLGNRANEKLLQLLYSSMRGFGGPCLIGCGARHNSSAASSAPRLVSSTCRTLACASTLSQSY